MAIVIDTCCWIKVVTNKKGYKELHNWLILRHRIKLGVCDELEDELYQPTKYRHVYLELKRKGKIKKLNSAEESQLQVKIGKIRTKCKSQDHFVLAMMIIAHFRLVVTEDKDLKKDVMNREILNPPGKIYKEKSRKSAERMLRQFGFLGD